MHQENVDVTVDGAYDTRKCHHAIADRGALAFIQPRKNAKGNLGHQRPYATKPTGRITLTLKLSFHLSMSFQQDRHQFIQKRLGWQQANLRLFRT